ncbi:MAG: nucleotidyltransferase domain-containing protein [Opitutaceae bacterium]|nr:nucleotidyltransferase domain-containing protein [Opitutaceae bacterium]
MCEFAWSEEIVAALIFGSQMRGDATPRSDLDIQIVVKKNIWERPFLGLGFVVRPGVRCWSAKVISNGAYKISVRSGCGAMDIVLLKWLRMEIACSCVRVGLHRRSPRIADALRPLAHVIGPGYRLVKGQEKWGRFFESIVLELGVPRLSDSDIRKLMYSACNDTLWMIEKCLNGERQSALRLLHRNLNEINLLLANEWLLRRGLRAVYDGRRAELMLSGEDLLAIKWLPELDCFELLQLIERSEAVRKCLGKEMLVD